MLITLVIAVGSFNVVIKSDWFNDQWKSVKANFNKNVAQPTSNNVEQVSRKLQSAANEITNTDTLLQQTVSELNSKIGQINTTLSEAKAIQGQIAASVFEAKKVWAMTTPTINKALTQARRIPEVTPVASAIKSSAEALQQVAILSGSGLQKIQILNAQVRNALGQVAKAINIVNQISNAVLIVGKKVLNTGNSVGITPLTQIGAAITDMSKQINGMGDAINTLSLTLGESLNILDEFSKESQSAATAVAKSSDSIAHNL